MSGESRTVHGIHPVLEALRARPGDIERVYVLEGSMPPRAAAEILSRARDAQVRVERVPRERLQALVEGGVHQGVAARLREFAYATVEEVLARATASGRPPLVVVLDGLQDPHNLGAVIRSADALGAHGVVLPKDRSVGVTPAVARASAGAVEHVPVARVTNLSRALEELKSAGLWVAAADPAGDQLLWGARLDGPLAVVIGAEGAGVRPGVLKHCDLRLRIPMEGRVASLNASVSAALVLYEVARQRGVGGGRSS
jgi:23S rRNA (guanosine2251-2'-O)-methyltransferase